jgi:hypothetical protein
MGFVLTGPYFVFIFGGCTKLRLVEGLRYLKYRRARKFKN